MLASYVEHVKQFVPHSTQILEIPTKLIGQVAIQVELYKFKVEQTVQVAASGLQVVQSESEHG